MAAIIRLIENELVKSFFVQNGWIQDGRIQNGRFQDGSHHQVDQIELVWVRVRLVWECFWVNLREDNKVSESKMPCVWIQHGRVQDGCHLQVESEWMSEVFLCKWWEPISTMWVSLRGKTKMAESKMAKFKMAELKMAAIIKLSQNEWVWVILN